MKSEKEIADKLEETITALNKAIEPANLEKHTPRGMLEVSGWLYAVGAFCWVLGRDAEYKELMDRIDEMATTNKNEGTQNGQ